ncbi:hypothetical protein HPP92_026742, partial [Vanilla planifolia]
MAPSQSATLSEVLFYATTVNLLLEVVRKVRRLLDAVEELASIAEFKRPEQAKSAAVKRAIVGKLPHVVVDMEGGLAEKRADRIANTNYMPCDGLLIREDFGGASFL